MRLVRLHSTNTRQGDYLNTPVDIYLGRTTGQTAILLIALQVGWLIVLVALGRSAAYAGRRKLTIQGG
jgi:viologen exporter family transport system permease protein